MFTRARLLFSLHTSTHHAFANYANYIKLPSESMQILAMFEAGTKFLGTFDTAGFFGEGLAGSNSHHLNILNKSNIVQHMLCDRSIQKPCVNCTFAVKNPCCLSFAFKTRWPAMTSHDQPTSLFTALVLVFDCAGLEGADGCDDEDGSCSGLNFNSFNSTLSLLSSEERLKGVATTPQTPQTPQTHTDSYRLHTTCAPYSWLSSFSWAIGVIWVSYLGPSSAKFSSPYRSSASFIQRE